MGTRGMVTEEVQAKAVEVLGEEISTVEFRLMPYIQYTLMNGKQLDPRNLNDQEWCMIDKWVQEGRLTIEDRKINATKEFWDALNEMMWLGYAS